MKLADVEVEDGRYPRISLSKLCGKTIADIRGRISMEFGDPTFKLQSVLFTDGTSLHCEGEHDFPYVTDATVPVLPDSEILNQLYKEQ